MASVALLTLVEEHFGVEIDIDDLDQFTSFELILGSLQKRNGGRHNRLVRPWT